jgi:ribosome recycling factor
MDKNALIGELTQKMNKSLVSLNHELSGLRTGRASASFLDPVQVDAYGTKMTIAQLGAVTITDPRTLSMQVWDASLIKAIEKGIVEANLGVSVAPSGTTLRISIPIPSEERRKELAKLASKYGENAKVSTRNIRRDGMEALKKAEKDTAISQDEHHILAEKIQKLTDDYVAKIDSAVSLKEREIISM